MKISVFLSYPKPHMRAQEEFIVAICNYLEQRSFYPRTLGRTDYDMDAPLVAIRRMMIESNGLITVAFRRTKIKSAIVRDGSDLNPHEVAEQNDFWLTSPYAHIEPAMAFQLGLPILIFRESGVLQDGILEKGVTGLYLPEFDLQQPIENFLASPQWQGLIGRWEGYVRAVADQKGRPQKLY